MLPRPIIAIAVVAALVSQDWSVQATTSLPSLAPSVTSVTQSSSTKESPAPTSSSQESQSTSSQIISPTTTSAPISTVSTGSTSAAGGSISTTISTTNTVIYTSVITTAAPQKPSFTCVTITFIWEKNWNDLYRDSKYAVEVSKTVESALEKGFFNDSRKYKEVNVSQPKVTKKVKEISVEVKLCLIVLKKDSAGYIEDILKTFDKLNDTRIRELAIQAFGVKFENWKAKDGECSKCGSSGTGGPFEIEGECTPKEGYSCNGLKTTKESDKCSKYCDSSAATQKTSFSILAVGILLSFSLITWK